MEIKYATDDRPHNSRKHSPNNDYTTTNDDFRMTGD
jgi:hypothetical protein